MADLQILSNLALLFVQFIEQLRSAEFRAGRCSVGFGVHVYLLSIPRFIAPPSFPRRTTPHETGVLSSADTELSTSTQSSFEFIIYILRCFE